MHSLNQIHVFKTNIDTEADKLSVKLILDGNEHIQQWNVDLHDVDRVLRIISSTIHPTQVIQLINNHGYQCSELV
ncbi:MAG: hypothetical protein HY305_00995 [Sphingobacteriales bacterium]|nr:hypothetical protein [Sphingobacteriales bacterium]